MDINKITQHINEIIDYSSLSEDEKDELMDIPIFEQAQVRSDFINFVSNIAWQIAENICLILYAEQYDESKLIYINHWKSELFAHCDNIYKKKLRSGDKQKTLSYALLNINDFADNDIVFEGLYSKFKSEQIDIYKIKYVIYDVIEQFQEILKNDLIPLMSSTKNLESLYSYIENL